MLFKIELFYLAFALIISSIAWSDDSDNKNNSISDSQIDNIISLQDAVFPSIQNSFETEALNYLHYSWDYKLALLSNHLKFIAQMSDPEFPLMQYFAEVQTSYYRILQNADNKKYNGFVSSGNQLIDRINKRKQELTAELDTLKQNTEWLSINQQSIVALVVENTKKENEIENLTKKALKYVPGNSYAIMEKAFRAESPERVIVQGLNQQSHYSFIDFLKIENSINTLTINIARLNKEIRILRSSFATP